MTEKGYDNSNNLMNSLNLLSPIIIIIITMERLDNYTISIIIKLLEPVDFVQFSSCQKRFRQVSLLLLDGKKSESSVEKTEIKKYPVSPACSCLEIYQSLPSGEKHGKYNVFLRADFLTPSHERYLTLIERGTYLRSKRQGFVYTFYAWANNDLKSIERFEEDILHGWSHFFTLTRGTLSHSIGFHRGTMHTKIIKTEGSGHLTFKYAGSHRKSIRMGGSNTFFTEVAKEITSGPPEIEEEETDTEENNNNNKRRRL